MRINSFWLYSLHRVVFPLCHVAKMMGVENIGHPYLRLTHFRYRLGAPFDGIRRQGE